jgi:hypothetical protein
MLLRPIPRPRILVIVVATLSRLLPVSLVPVVPIAVLTVLRLVIETHVSREFSPYVFELHIFLVAASVVAVADVVTGRAAACTTPLDSAERIAVRILTQFRVCKLLDGEVRLDVKMQLDLA